jgi:hypothetical protein
MVSTIVETKPKNIVTGICFVVTVSASFIQYNFGRNLSNYPKAIVWFGMSWRHQFVWIPESI